MEPYFKDATVTLHHGDCLDVMRAMPDASVDAVVTDPPYGLGFMGKEWDDLPPGEPWARECLRVLKPGGHLLAFGGTRTWHRLACAVEDAGFEVRDSIAWMYGSGFPKSLDVSKAIDKQRHDQDDVRRVTAWVAATRTAAGVTNRDIDAAFGFNGMAGHWTAQGAQAAIPTLDQVPRLLDVLKVTPEDVPDEIRALLIDLNGLKGQPGPAWFAREVIQECKVTDRRGDGTVVGLGYTGNADVTAPATDAARTWQGWGSAMKPAFEPVVVARKPFKGTLAANVLAHGTGALNIDGCRIGTEPAFLARRGGVSSGGIMNDTDGERVTSGGNGRWPANVVLDDHQAAELDKQSGVITSGKMRAGIRPKGERETYGQDAAAGYETTRDTPGDTGGASRFFYVARDLDNLAARFMYEAKAPTDERPRVNGVAHNTVKPLALMRWLVRLVTPPGGTVFEPFAGSGTTVEACILEGFRCIAIEREAEYLPLIAQRIARRLDPVEAVRGAGEDGGLFDLLDDRQGSR